MKIKHQKGFTLLELGITTTIATLGIVAMIQMQAYQAQAETARSIAQVYQRLNNAVGSYMSTFYDQIIKADAQCSRVSYRAGGSSTAPGPGANCFADLSLNGRSVRVVNVLQPTLPELVKFGFLGDANGVEYVNRLPLSTFANQDSPLNLIDNNSRSAPDEFGVVIQMICITGVDNGRRNGNVVDDKARCQSSSFDLRSLVMNMQPYNLPTTRVGSSLLDQILASAGGDAYMSDTLTDASNPNVNASNIAKFELRSMAGSVEATIMNPMRWSNAANLDYGVPNIIAMRNGFGSSGYDQFLRRAGNMTLTGDWDVSKFESQKRSITGINEVEAVTGKFSGNVDVKGDVAAKNGNFTGNVGAVNGNFTGDVAAKNGNFTGNVGAKDGNFTGNVGVTGNVGAKDGTFTGTVKGTTGIFGDFAESVTAALKATTAYISGTLTVGGATVLKSTLIVLGATELADKLTVKGNTILERDLTVTGDTLLKGKTTADFFRLGSGAALGDVCDSTKESLRRANTPANGSPIEVSEVKLLVCDPVTSKWTRAQKDYAVEIRDLGGRVTKTEGDITDITNINTSQGGNITGLLGDVKNIYGLIKDPGGLRPTVDDHETRIGKLEVYKTQNALDVKDMKNGILQLENNQMRWDLLSVDWAPMSCDRNGFNCSTNEKVWKKTPWQCNTMGMEFASSVTQGAFNTNMVDSQMGVKWLRYASSRQKTPGINGGATMPSSSPPMLLGIDNAPQQDTIVFDVNCATWEETNPGGIGMQSYWYVGISAVNANTSQGNDCRSGLGSRLWRNKQPPNGPYDPNSTDLKNEPCKGFNTLAPSLNKSKISARFMAFTVLQP